MGSYCQLNFDNLNIDSWKSVVPDHMVSLFQENERTVRYENENLDDEWKFTVYRAKKDDVLLRLDLMGITFESAKEAFEKWRYDEIELHKEYMTDGSDWAVPTKEALDKFTIEEWMLHAPFILKNRYNLESEREPQDIMQRQMMDDSYDEGWLFFACSDIRYVYRLILETCTQIQWITLDISSLVNGGYYDEDVRLINSARNPESLEKSILEPIVIMGEGRTDIRTLKESLVSLYPNVQEIFSFFDHDTLSVDGGAGFLLKFLKAFAAARTPIKIIAVFDNDAAGRFEFDKIKRMALPSNIQAICLPEIEFARTYPTVGPQGVHDMDVNGSAVGIEFFMGKHNLCNASGSFVPVRWTQYYAGSQSYQGEIPNKEDVQKQFFLEISSCTDSAAAKAKFPELDLLWRNIFEMTHRLLEKKRPESLS